MGSQAQVAEILQGVRKAAPYLEGQILDEDRCHQLQNENVDLCWMRSCCSDNLPENSQA